MGTAATEMSKIKPETKRKNTRDIFKFLNTQGSEIRYLNGEDTLLTALLAVPGTHQIKVVYGMCLRTARIFQTSNIANKALTLYGEGYTAICPSRTLVLDATVRDKVLV